MKSLNLSRVNIQALNILIFLFPLAYLTGNFIININVLLICILGILVYQKKIIRLDLFKTNFFIFLFFLFTIIISAFNYINTENEEGFFKSILFLRYLILFLILKFMMENNDLNIRMLLISCAMIVSFIAVDVIFQMFSGKNIFGLESLVRHNSSIFGEELIAGGFMQKFSLLGLAYVPFVFNKLNKKKLIFFLILMVIFFSGILFSGNRMPLILFFLSMILMMILFNRLKLTIFIGLIVCTLIFVLTFNYNTEFKKHYSNYYYHSLNLFESFSKYSKEQYPELENNKNQYFIKEYVKGKDKEKLQEKYSFAPIGSGHVPIYLTAYDILSDNLFFGGGLKSFRLNCKTKLHLPNRVCSSHPHNYYLELLNDTGLIGTIILLLGLFYIIKNNLYNLGNYGERYKLIIICFLIILFTEFFPIKSSGSFFSTSSASFIFFILGLTTGIKEKLKK